MLEFYAITHFENALCTIAQFNISVIALTKRYTEQCEMSRRKNNRFTFPLFIHKV